MEIWLGGRSKRTSLLKSICKWNGTGGRYFNFISRSGNIFYVLNLFFLLIKNFRGKTCYKPHGTDIALPPSARWFSAWLGGWIRECGGFAPPPPVNMLNESLNSMLPFLYFIHSLLIWMQTESCLDQTAMTIPCPLHLGIYYLLHFVSSIHRWVAITVPMSCE